MGIIKRFGTAAKGILNASNPYGIGLMTSAGILNRAEGELKSGKNLIESILIAIETGNASYVDEEIRKSFYDEMIIEFEDGSLTFISLAVGWTILAYSVHVKGGRSWEVTDEEKKQILEGVIETIEKHWDDTFYLKRSLKAY